MILQWSLISAFNSVSIFSFYFHSFWNLLDHKYHTLFYINETIKMSSFKLNGDINGHFSSKHNMLFNYLCPRFSTAHCSSFFWLCSHHSDSATGISLFTSFNFIELPFYGSNWVKSFALATDEATCFCLDISNVFCNRHLSWRLNLFLFQHH